MFLTNEEPLFVAKGRARENNGTAAITVIPKRCLLYQHIMFLTDKGAIFAGFTKEVLKNTENFITPGHEWGCLKEVKLCSPPKR